MTIRIYDRAIKALSSRKLTKEGYLKAPVILARTGVQEYAPHELIGATLPPHLAKKSKIRIDRPASAVFDQNFLDALELLPVTDGHPSEDVTATNAKRYIRGVVTGSGYKVDEKYVGATVLVQDADTVTLVDQGKDQLSLGYDLDMHFYDEEESKIKGVDGYVKSIFPNHLAIVNQARGGKNVRIIDKGDPMKIVIIDGISYEFPEQSAQVVEKLLKDKAALVDEGGKNLQTLKDEMSTLKAKHDALEKDLEKEQKAKLSDEDINTLVEKRAKLLDAASKFIKDVDLVGKNDSEIKKAVIASVYDSLDLEEKDDTYIEAMYDTILLSNKGGQTQKLADSFEKKVSVVDSTKARDDMRARRGNARKVK